MKSLFASCVLAAAASASLAAPQTVTLSVPGMTCAACPITVKRSWPPPLVPYPTRHADRYTAKSGDVR